MVGPDGVVTQDGAAGPGGGVVVSHYVVDVIGDAAALATELRRTQHSVKVDADRLQITFPTGDTAALWQAAVTCGVGIRSFRPQQEAMADAFVRHLRLDDPTRRAGEGAP